MKIKKGYEENELLPCKITDRATSPNPTT